MEVLGRDIAHGNKPHSRRHAALVVVAVLEHLADTSRRFATDYVIVLGAVDAVTELEDVGEGGTASATQSPWRRSARAFFRVVTQGCTHGLQMRRHPLLRLHRAEGEG
jgi:hypothetical protein